jgi:transposase
MAVDPLHSPSKPRVGILDPLWPWPFSPQDWERTPAPVPAAFVQLTATMRQRQDQVASLQRQVEELCRRLGQNSQNSSRPPSSDSLSQREQHKKTRRERRKPAARKRGGQSGHAGHKMTLLEPTEPTLQATPKACRRCGRTDLRDVRLSYVHQCVDASVRLLVQHVECFEATCACGTVTAGAPPAGLQTGYGPFLTALTGHLTGLVPTTRRAVVEVLRSVFGVPVELGTSQKLVDRCSKAIKIPYEAIEASVRRACVNYVDETSYYLCHSLRWLWAMVNPSAALYKVMDHRDSESFQILRGDWNATLVSDDYGVYRAGDDERAQRCLAHLIRKANALTTHSDPALAEFGRKIALELARLCEMSHAPPTAGQWQAWLMRITGLLRQHEDRRDEAGKLARAIQRQRRSLWTFLLVPGVEPTNNRAERALRFAVIWRKRSLGAQSDKGCRWFERILSLRETCRLRGKNLFHVLLDAVRSSFHGEAPDLAWLSA